jgi:cytochrome c553
MEIRLLVFVAMCLAAAPVPAQDAARGARLYAQTAGETGRSVAACVDCHADMGALRELLVNRRGRCDDAASVARWLEAAVSGARPGAVNAKAQYRGVLKPKDLRDLGAYIACARQASVDPQREVVAGFR